MKKLVLATKNKNKLIEIEDLMKNLDIEIIGVDGDFDPEETGSTFEENAYIKASEAAKIMDIPALADDSGLVVDALDGRPGVYSSRYAENDQKRIEKLLDELKDLKPEDRTARFVSSMVIVDPDGNTLHACTGKCEGLIIDEKRGDNGFGYDPVFFIPQLNATLAEISLQEKNKISHRSKALNCIMDWLRENY